MEEIPKYMVGIQFKSDCPECGKEMTASIARYFTKYPLNIDISKLRITCLHCGDVDYVMDGGMKLLIVESQASSSSAEKGLDKQIILLAARMLEKYYYISFDRRDNDINGEARTLITDEKKLLEQIEKWHPPHVPETYKHFLDFNLIRFLSDKLKEYGESLEDNVSDKLKT